VCFGECLTSSLWHEINAYWFELQGYHAGWSPCTFGLLHLPWPTRWIGNIPFRQWCRFGQGAKGNPKVSTKYKHLNSGYSGDVSKLQTEHVVKVIFKKVKGHRANLVPFDKAHLPRASKWDDGHAG
jgi:hypothetical protein